MLSWFSSHLELSGYSQHFGIGKKLSVEFPSHEGELPKPGRARAQGVLWEPLCLFSGLFCCLTLPAWVWRKGLLLSLRQNQRQGEFPRDKEQLDKILVDESLEKPLPSVR